MARNSVENQLNSAASSKGGRSKNGSANPTTGNTTRTTNKPGKGARTTPTTPPTQTTPVPAKAMVPLQNADLLTMTTAQLIDEVSRLRNAVRLGRKAIKEVSEERDSMMPSGTTGREKDWGSSQAVQAYEKSARKPRSKSA